MPKMPVATASFVPLGGGGKLMEQIFLPSFEKEATLATLTSDFRLPGRQEAECLCSKTPSCSNDGGRRKGVQGPRSRVGALF